MNCIKHNQFKKRARATTNEDILALRKAECSAWATMLQHECIRKQMPMYMTTTELLRSRSMSNRANTTFSKYKQDINAFAEALGDKCYDTAINIVLRIDSYREFLYSMINAVNALEQLKTDTIADIIQRINLVKRLRNDIALNNIGLIHNIIIKYTPRLKTNFMDVDELISEGYLALAGPVLSKYDVGRGLAFATYAHFWLVLAITRATNTSRLIKIPLIEQQKALKLRSTKHALMLLYGKHGELTQAVPADLQLLAASTHLCNKSIHEQLTPGRTKGDGGSTYTLEDTYTNTRMGNDQEYLAFIREIKSKWKKGLTSKQIHIISQYYYEGRTLEDIGNELGLSRERVRQLLNETRGIIAKKLQLRQCM